MLYCQRLWNATFVTVVIHSGDIISDHFLFGFTYLLLKKKTNLKQNAFLVFCHSSKTWWWFISSDLLVLLYYAAYCVKLPNRATFHSSNFLTQIITRILITTRCSHIYSLYYNSQPIRLACLINKDHSLSFCASLPHNVSLSMISFMVFAQSRPHWPRCTSSHGVSNH